MSTTQTPEIAEQKPTKQVLIIEELKKLKQVDDSFDKKAFVKEHWGHSDFFTQRSFDVLFVHAKKKFPNNKFKSINGGLVTRLV